MRGEMGDKRLAVLAYHKIGEPSPDGWDTWYYIPEATFVEQIKFVCDSEWSVIDLTTFLIGLDRPETMPDRGLLLTFDDGHKSVLTVTYPILQRFGFPAVCFVSTDYIGTHGTFGGGAEPEEPMCDWDDLRELERNGVAIQSHGVSHNWLSLIDKQQRREEFVQSKRILEEGLGKPIEVFAYPYSDFGGNDDTIDEALRQAGYRAAFLCGGGLNTNALPIQDPFRIDRLAMYRDTDLASELPI